MEINHLSLLHAIISPKNSFPGWKPVDEGRLLDHTLRHTKVSHHGRYEWQSPKRPKTIEACLVHYADAMEADMWKFCSMRSNVFSTDDILPSIDDILPSRDDTLLFVANIWPSREDILPSIDDTFSVIFIRWLTTNSWNCSLSMVTPPV
ncbi:MAG: hypothetical protein ACYC21_06800 [Eubacteriales bacterium]